MNDISRNSGKIREQERLNRVLVQLKKQKFKINTTFLNTRQYMNGASYFQRLTKLFPNTNDACHSINKTECPVFVVHNNWIVSKEAKIFRFREHLMWLYDGKDRYYSSETRKYLTYTNPKPNVRLSLQDQQDLTERQVSALKTALAIGHLLDRAVILPKFYCGPNAVQCLLNSFIRIKTFDDSFSGHYRESSFLRHPQVPDSVKQSFGYQQLLSHATRSSHASKIYTIASDRVVRLFRNLKDKVINFGILEKVVVKFSNDSTDARFDNNVRKAFQLSDYMQVKLGKFL